MNPQNKDAGYLQEADFAKLNPGVLHGFTTRDLGNDYEKIAQVLHLPVSQICYLEQTHSADVIRVNSPPGPLSCGQERGSPSGGETAICLGQGDALVTDQPGLVIGVKTADCIPLLAQGKNQKGKTVVAAIHAGWRGVHKGIIQNAVAVMQKDFCCEVADLYFAFGPCLRVQNFEFGHDDLKLLRERYPSELVFQDGSPSRPHLDLVATAKKILLNLGCGSFQIHDINLCTFERQDLFHSYRHGELKGRQFSFVGII